MYFSTNCIKEFVINHKVVHGSLWNTFIAKIHGVLQSSDPIIILHTFRKACKKCCCLLVANTLGLKRKLPRLYFSNQKDTTISISIT